jgi:hypothetical protein
MSRSLPAEVAHAVADTKDVDPENLGYTLEDHVDTDALRLLADHENASWTRSFELAEVNATVTSDGLILVDGSPERTWN